MRNTNNHIGYRKFIRGKIRFDLNSISFLEFTHSYENRHVLWKNFPQYNQVSTIRYHSIITLIHLFLGYVKKREMASAKSREQRNREVDRCGCQTGLSEECEIRVLLRETGGRFKDGNIFHHRTIFTFAYITFYVYTFATLYIHIYISRILFIFILYALRAKYRHRRNKRLRYSCFNAVAAAIYTTVTNSCARCAFTLLLFCPISSSRL